MWKLEGTVRSQNANNVKNYFACFQNYTQEYVLKIRNIDLFLILFPVGYLNTILIPEINKVFEYTLDPGELMRWVYCLFYVACWIGIPDSNNWWSVTL